MRVNMLRCGERRPVFGCSSLSGNEQMVTPSGCGLAGSPVAAALGASQNGHYVSFALGQKVASPLSPPQAPAPR